MEERGEPRERTGGSASDEDVDPREKGKSKSKQADDAETDEQAEETFPASDAPSW